MNKDDLYLVSVGAAGYPCIWSYNSTDAFAPVAASAYFNDALLVVKTGDRLICNVGEDSITNSFGGTFRNDGTNVYVDWDRTYFFQTQMADVSAASTAYIGQAPAGIITQVYGVLWSAVTVASSIVTFSIGSTAITGGNFTVTTAGVAGQLYTATPTALNTTSAGNVVKAVSDGGSTTTAIMTLGYKIICPSQV